MRIAPFAALLLTAGLFTACGGNVVDVPESIPVTTYPTSGFRMTVVLQSCSDICAEYQPSECSVSVNSDDKEIEVDASVCFERVVDDCANTCGRPVVAHCDVPSLAAGTYTVVSHQFRQTITVQ